MAREISTADGTVHFTLRPADKIDFDFAWALYEDLMKSLTAELLEWREEAQRRVVAEGLASNEVEIIEIETRSIGWVQVREEPAGLVLGQLYVIPELQGRGIGTSIIRHLMARARHDNKSVRLGVMKNNRAKRLYERLGFVCTGEDRYKHYLTWQAQSNGIG